MRNLISALLVFLPILVGSPNAQTGYYVELDLDGQSGNGPDWMSAAVSDYILMDVWVHGPDPLFSVGFNVCNFNGALEYQGAIANVPSPWSLVSLLPPSACFDVSATDFTFSIPVTPPWMFFTFTYHAAVDHAIGELTLDDSPNSSAWLNTSFDSGTFDYITGAAIQIGATDTDASSWGEIKNLFR